MHDHFDNTFLMLHATLNLTKIKVNFAFTLRPYLLKYGQYSVHISDVWPFWHAHSFGIMLWPWPPVLTNIKVNFWKRLTAPHAVSSFVILLPHMRTKFLRICIFCASSILKEIIFAAFYVDKEWRDGDCRTAASYILRSCSAVNWRPSKLSVKGPVPRRVPASSPGTGPTRPSPRGYHTSSRYQKRHTDPRNKSR